MAYLLGCWIPNLGVPSWKPLGGSQVHLAYHPSEVDQKTRNLVVKSKLSPRSVSMALRQLGS